MPLWRWVEMPVWPERADTVRELLLRQAPLTRSFPGCLALTLYESKGSTFYSLSSWVDAEALERYRASSVFRTFWATLRPHFREAPRAVSLQTIGTF
jgi:quinol monooxygenase YgiN